MNPFYIVDTPIGEGSGDVLEAFAWDELVCRKVGAGLLPPVARIWRHPQAMVLGLRDRRLPYAGRTIEAMRANGVSVGVRNSGGAAVPLDEGVVNISLIFPYGAGRKLDFHQEFRLMADLIAAAAGEWSEGTRAGEVQGAYCPGEYDLGIGGQKFCGIAQRRQLKAYAVSAFIVACGSGAERGQRAQAFYRAATGGSHHPDDPGVVPSTMASLQELAGVPSAEAFISSLIHQLELLGGKKADSGFAGKVVSEQELVQAVGELRRRYDHD